LDSSLLRRDEIKFVEREDETGKSIHYALSDFKTADGIRKGEDYMNNYFVNRYGAIKEVDFSDFIEQMIKGKEVAADD
jgi:hypothetical protein